MFGQFDGTPRATFYVFDSPFNTVDNDIREILYSTRNHSLEGSVELKPCMMLINLSSLPRLP